MNATVGRIVHVNIGTVGKSRTDYLRPAVVTAVVEDNVCNVRLFLDGDNDRTAPLVVERQLDPNRCPRLAAIREGTAVGEWRWPEQAPAASAEAPPPKRR